MKIVRKDLKKCAMAEPTIAYMKEDIINVR